MIWSFMSEHKKFRYPRVEIDDNNKISHLIKIIQFELPKIL
jgi:hypothetical protein